MTLYRSLALRQARHQLAGRFGFGIISGLRSFFNRVGIWNWAEALWKLLIKDLKKADCCREGGYTRSVIPATSFFKISSYVRVTVGPVIGGEDGFQNDRMLSRVSDISF